MEDWVFENREEDGYNFSAHFLTQNRFSQVYMPPAAPSSNKENLSLPFQDTFHLLRRKETESKIWSHWFTTETSVLWVMRCHPEVHRILLSAPSLWAKAQKMLLTSLEQKACVGACGGSRNPAWV